MQSHPSNADAVYGPPPVRALQKTDQLCFDRFVLIPGERLLTKDNTPVEIGGRSLDLLLALVEQPGRVVSKQELFERVWPGAAIVEDATLRFHMASLRKLLGDGKDSARFITTQVGVGYAFVGAVRRTKAIVSHGPLRPKTRPGGRLPSPLDRLIGRAPDLRRLAERVAGARILTIVGAPGVGKTSLAIALAHTVVEDFPDGADFIDLAGVNDPDQVAAVVLDSLKAPFEGQAPLTALLDHLRDQQRLLVLDNCEHLIRPLADLVERTATTAPAVRILLTSRQALRARGEQVHRLAPLDCPADLMASPREALLASPAVDLFLQVVGAAGGVVDDDLDGARAIARLCRRLDGTPLPIELAALRAAIHGVDATARLLGAKPSLLWPGRRTAWPRQQTLRATLDWSYDLLSETARLVLERLSILVEPFSLEVALDLVADETLDAVGAAAALDELAESSLIWPRNGEYRLPEMTRAYAWDRLGARAPLDADTASLRRARGVVRVFEAQPRHEIARLLGVEIAPLPDCGRSGALPC